MTLAKANIYLQRQNCCCSKFLINSAIAIVVRGVRTVVVIDSVDDLCARINASLPDAVPPVAFSNSILHQMTDKRIKYAIAAPFTTHLY